MKIIKRKAMLEKTGLAATTQWRLEKQGLFPSRQLLSSRLVGWIEEEVEAWIMAGKATVGTIQPLQNLGSNKRGRKPGSGKKAVRQEM